MAYCKSHTSSTSPCGVLSCDPAVFPSVAPLHSVRTLTAPHYIVLHINSNPVLHVIPYYAMLHITQCYTLHIVTYNTVLHVTQCKMLPELLKVEDVQTHVCAMFFENLRKIFPIERETGKRGILLGFGHNLTKFFKVLLVFMSF